MSGARSRIAADNAARRNREAACALDFLVYGDDEASGPHARRCVHGVGDPCSRNYDPLPYPEAEPDESLYEGTSIAALYGIGGGEHLLGIREMAGWTLRPRSTE